MTVEQSPLPVRTAQRTREDNSSLIYAKVREVTGAPDNVIDEAIKACIRRDGTYKVEDVVTTIITDDSVARSNKNKSQHQQPTNTKVVTPAEITPGPAAGSGDSLQTMGLKRNVAVSGGPVSQPKQDSDSGDFIDLTRDAQVILGGQVSREEQDISRVLEQSLAESKGGTKRKRGELWFIDPLNPHERKRQDGWPVGLKNVGNTCWFSAVIQSLFHIQEFQNLVLAFKGDEGVDDSSLRRNTRFVLELKQLFALLACSARKYVDPSKAVNILKEDSSAVGADGQQDVSEFQHKLLDWLEDAFSVTPTPSTSSTTTAPKPSTSSSCASSSSSSPSSYTSSLQIGMRAKENPMKRLFLGKYKAEGINEGKVFHQEVTFGQYPLNVLGFRDIHESLEATMAQGEIETLSSNSGQKSGQEIWFTHLPVVLTFELSRFGFNPQLNQAEKIHQQLFFPQVIYMDRYLECNKSCIRQKREEARKLREQLSCLQGKLDKFMNYGSSSKRYPLPDVLQYALDFAQSSPPTPTPSHPNDVEMEVAPVPSTRSESTPNSSSSLHCQDVSMSSLSDSPSNTLSKHHTATTTATKTTITHTVMVATTTSSSPLSSTSSATSTSPSLSADLHALSSHSHHPDSLRDRAGGSGDGYNKKHFPSLMTSPNVISAAVGLGSPQTASSSSSLAFTTHPPTPTFEPCPREVTESELRVLQDCLRRWRTEVEADVRELQNNISVLEGKLSSLYCESAMQKYPYHLHAVLVHEGQAVSGHYWSFIYDNSRGIWLKFNDITVSKSSWEEMHKESIGGFHNASAYCLMYADRSRLESGDNTTRPVTVNENLASLPVDLRQMVNNDNALFQQETDAWDCRQRGNNGGPSSIICQESASTSSVATMTTSPPPSTSSTTTSPPSSVCSPPPHHNAPTCSSSPLVSSPPSHNTTASASTTTKARTLPSSSSRTLTACGASESDLAGVGQQQQRGSASITRPAAIARLSEQHAQLSLQPTLAAIRDALSDLKPIQPQPAELFDKAMTKERQRLKGLATTHHLKLPSDDLRLCHPILYLMASNADARTIEVVLSEQFSLCHLLDGICEGVKKQAQDHFTRLYHSASNGYYQFWHKRYSHYRQAVARFVVGLEAYCSDRHQEALPYFIQAWLHNCEPGLDTAIMGTVGISPTMLAYFRRSSLQRLNETTMKMFESDIDITDALTIMAHQILPALSYILSSNIKEDVRTAEVIREKWCQFLEKDLDDEKIKRLQDFLSKMFEISGVVHETPEPVRPSDLTRDLHDRYIRAMRKVKERGELEMCIQDS